MPYLSCWDANPSFPTFFFPCFSSIINLQYIAEVIWNQESRQADLGQKLPKPCCGAFREKIIILQLACFLVIRGLLGGSLDFIFIFEEINCDRTWQFFLLGSHIAVFKHLQVFQFALNYPGRLWVFGQKVLCEDQSFLH